ncbi:hypothetical protein ACFVWR_01215 [Leifsonia sp. NPDC058292]|uniref:hypothetical protein n=1 Tax=Leifsonia sp. NPDC058292 TaxID=3346428 RepID=UPI0036DB7A87
MSEPSDLHFVGPVRQFFSDQPEVFGRRVHLRDVDQDGVDLTIRFDVESDDRHYAAYYIVPRRIGDERWRTYFDPAMEPHTTIEHWVQWAVVLPLVEAYDTTPDKVALPFKDQAYWFDLR